MRANCRFLLVVLPALLFWAWSGAAPARACGGLFCQNNPVDQNAERIIFTQNGDGTVSAIVQIQYTGFDEDFSWILPLPEPIPAEAIEAPETATAAFTELELATNPVFIPPARPDCAQVDMVMSEGAVPMAAGGVELFASGEVGPFGFDIIGSQDPQALITWLREHNYRVTPPMEPLIDVYVQEQFVFLAMRLLPERGVQDIQPIQVTYPAERPMIPLRLTAVAANPDMAVLTWFFADAQATPANYAHMEIADSELTFFTFGGHNYRQLMSQRADEFNGQAFITEYAGPTSDVSFSDPLLQALQRKHRYLTRLNTVISPEEMTVDPVFDYDPQRPNVSNIHDLSGMSGLYDCERAGAMGASNQTGLSELFGGGQPATNNPRPESAVQDNSLYTGILIGVGIALAVALLLGVGILLGRRAR
jgi:hypothetical protein